MCIADEVPFEIPESWEWVRIGTVFTLQAGKNIKASDIFESNFDGSYLCYGGNGVRGYVKSYNREGTYPIIGRQGALCGNIKYAKGKFYATEHAVCVETFAKTNVKWACAFLEALNLNQYATATAQPGLAVANINTILIPLPPKNEQQRIVDILITLQPFIKTYTKKEGELQSLNQQFSNLLKKSILQNAVQGKLVPQNPSDEPASVLLEHIRAEKERLIQEGKIKRDKHESVIYRRDNSYYERLDGIERCIGHEIQFEIPETWCWCRLGNLIHSIDAGKSFKCDERPPEQNECGIIKISAVTGRSFNQEESKTCYSTSQWIRDYAIQPGDFLICRANTVTLVGGCVIVEKISKKLMLSDKVLRLSFFNSVNKWYILYIMRSPFVRTQLSAAASGTSESMKNISQDAIKSLLIPFPPLKEQYRIVFKIGESLPKVMTL